MLRSFRVVVRVCTSCVLGLLIIGVLQSPSVSAQQRLNFYAGQFVPRGDQSESTGIIFDRADGDVLVANSDFLAFNLKDFRAGSYGAEYLTGLGNFFEAGLSIG